MSEQVMRQRVIHALKRLDAISVENAVYPGTPDVNFAEGWIELKWVNEWPACDGSTVVLRHFTAQQRVWLMRRWRAGGNAWLMLQCKREWFLFTGETAANIVGKATRSSLITFAHKYWEFGLQDDELIEALKR